MPKEANVIRYYVLCNKLKDVIRTGWKDWNVERQRVESVAEHIFGVQMLAIAMYSEYKYDIDISRVILMLAVHELEEIYIGDLTQFQISREEKEILGKEAVSRVLGNMGCSEDVSKLILEFDERKTKEALFAYHCDKLECDLQAKLYDEEECVDLNNQQENSTFYDAKVQELLTREKTWSDMWLAFGQDKYNYDENFRAISDYAKGNNISELKRN
jgi:putative hydrolase of HD superfamily